MIEQEIIERFSLHRATDEEGKARQDRDHEQIRDLFRDFALFLNDVLPEGRDKSIALTKLDEGLLFANKSVASRYPIQK